MVNKKRVLSLILAFVMLLGFIPSNALVSTAKAEELVDERPLTLRPKEVPLGENWTAGSNLNDEINRGSVKLRDRFRGNVINPLASDEARIQVLSLMNSKAQSRSSVGAEGFKTYAFDNWQYTDSMIFWDGKIPTPDVIDAAHRNGVPIYGTLFFNWSTSSADMEVLTNFLREDSPGSGTFPEARKYVDIAKYYGFDGYFINQETTGPGINGKGAKMRDLMIYAKKYAESVNYPIRFSWYDAMTNEGPRKHYNAVNSNNDYFVKPKDGVIPGDEFFVNFNWTKQGNKSSAEHMKMIGRSPFDAYAGFELQQNSINTRIRWNDLIGGNKKAIISIGLFTPDSILGFSKDGEDYHVQERNFWTGYEGDPSISGDRQGWRGMSRFVSDSSPVTSIPFKTFFNTGHGRNWFENGKLSRDYDWNARGVSEVLPTWRWWIQTSGTRLQGKYDYDDAYYGGNSIKFHGTLDAENQINLYSTKLEATSSTKLKLVTKGGENSTVSVGVTTDEKYSNGSFVYTSITPSVDWEETEVDLSQFAGQTIRAINVKIDGNAENYSFNIGELSVYDSGEKVASPTNVKVKDHLIFDARNSEAVIEFDRVDGADYYVVYADNGENSVYIQASSSNLMYLPNIERKATSQGTVQKLRIVAVGLNGTVSEPTEIDLDWKMEVEDTGNGIVIDSPNVVLGAKVLDKSAEESGEKAENALNGTITGNSDKWTVARARSGYMDIRLTEERTIRRWRVEHAGHGGESVNDGLMNTKDFELQYRTDSNSPWVTAKRITNNKAHVTDVNLDEPITAQEFRLKINIADNGSPWGAIRIYNWMMFEQPLDLEKTTVVPMSQVTADHIKDDEYKVALRNVEGNTKVELFSDREAKNLIAEQKTTAKGNVIFDNQKLEGESGLVYYRTTADGKEPSEILAVYYEKADKEQPEPVTCEIVQEKLTESNIYKTTRFWVDYNQTQTRESALVDGDESTIVWYGADGNAYQKGDYVGLDLKEVKRLDKFTFVSGGLKSNENKFSGPAGDYFKSYVVKYSENGSTWKTFGDEITQSKPVQKNVIDFSKEEINARYVIVEATVNEKKWVRFSEMSISTLKCAEQPDKADKTALIERVDEITKELPQLNKDKTKETLDALQQKLNEAKEVIKDKDATEEKVAEALAALNKAYDALENKEPIPEIKNPFGDKKARIVSVDAGRKYFSVEQLKQIIDEISKANYTHLHLLLGNDGMRFLLDDMSITTSKGNYKSEDVKAGITKGNQKYADSKRVTTNASTSLTQAEMDQIFEYAKEKNIKIIPSINSPGHMDAILVAMEELGIQNPYAYNGSRKSVTTLDIEREDVKEFTKEFVQLYIDYFASKGAEIFNFGADEYANDAFQNPGWSHLVQTGKYDKFVEYANDLSERILRAGMRPMAFNDGFYYGSKTNAEFNKQIIIALWTAGWSGFNVAPSKLFIEKGHDVLNVNDSWYYVMGRENSYNGWYHRQMALEGIKNKAFDVNVGDQIETIGSMVAMWADEPRREFELDKFVDWINAFANRNPEQFTKEVEEEVNKEKLKDYVNTVNDLLPSLEDIITSESLEKINNKLREAKDILAKPDAKQEEVDKIHAELKDAFENAKLKGEEPEVVNKDELKLILDLMKELLPEVKDLLTEDSVKALENQFEASQKVLDNDKATQTEVNESLKALNEAYKALKVKEAPETPELNTEKLENLIESIESKLDEIQEKVKPESIKNLKEKLAEAKAVLEKEKLTQEEVDEQVMKLIDAFTNVEFKDVENEVEVVDTSSLEKLIRKGELKLRENLTKESAEKLDEAIRQASQLLNKEDLTNEELTEEIMKLLDTILSVEHEKEEQPEPEQPEDPKDPEEPEDPKLHEAKGYITGTTNVRISPNGQVIGTLAHGAVVEGEYEEGSDWVKFNYYGQEAYVYKPLLLNTIEVKGFASGDSNIRKSLNGEVIGLAKREEVVKGVVSIDNPNWIKTDKGYIYRPLVVDTIKVRGLMSGTTNVRMTPNGTLIGTLRKAEYVEGTLNISNPNWVRVRYQNRDGYVYRSLIVDSVSVSGTVTATVNVRQTPNGKVLGTHRKGVKLTGKVSVSNPNWVEIQYKGQRAYVYKEFVK